MKRCRPNILPLLAIVLLPLLGGCRKDLCYDHYRSAIVNTTWEQAWERDYGKGWNNHWDDGQLGYKYTDFMPGIPEGISALLYEGDNEKSKTFLPPSGGEIVLGEREEGTSLLLYNNDTQYIVFNDMAQAPSARASTTTRTRASLGVLHADERTINPPDVLYAAFVPDLKTIGYHERHKIDVKMQPLVYTYLIRFKIEKGLEYISLARGALAGMAESVMLRDGSTPDEKATLLFDCELTAWGAEAQVRSFGVAGFPDHYYGSASAREAQQKYTLNFEVRLPNGTITSLLFDVTDQLINQPRGGVIEVENIEIEAGDVSFDSGFDVNVSDWGEYEDIDLPITH